MNIVTFDYSGSPRHPDGRRPRMRRRVIRLHDARSRRRDAEAPTPLEPHATRKPIEIRAVDDETPRDLLRVVKTFVALIVRLEWMKLRGKDDPRRSGEEIREAFESLGGLWMKVGQLMSLRRDVLPPALCDELAHLQHRAIGFPPEVAKRAIETELGAPIDAIFSEFDPLPFAAASLSQVHAARLRKNGREVVVKVLRPGIREKFERDLRVLRYIANCLDRLPRLRILRLRDAIVELEQIFLEETDYRYEAANAKQMRKNIDGRKIKIPKVYQRYSTAGVIVLERIHGVLMSDLIRVRESDPQRVRDWLAENGIDRKRVGIRLLISFMRQLFQDNFFHADLHPGNIILLRDNRIALIDLGSIGSLDREFLTLYRGLQRALAEQDFGKAADLQLRLCVELPSRGMHELRGEIARCLRLWSNKSKIKSLSFTERSINTGAADIGRILSRRGAQQTWEFLKIARTLSTLDASLEYLHVEMNYIAVLQKHFASASKSMLAKGVKPANLVRFIGGMAASAEEYYLFMAPTLRENAFTINASLSKASRILGTGANIVSFVFFIAVIVLLYKHFVDHLVDDSNAARVWLLHELSSLLPSLSFEMSLLVIALAVLGLIATRMMMKELLQPDDGK